MRTGYRLIMFLMVDTLSFSEWLNTQMKQRGLSQSELARNAGVSRAVIHKTINRLTKKPAPDTCVAIAKALKLSSVTVFRAAKLLPPETEISDWDDFRVILEEISKEGRTELFAIAKVKLELEKKGEVIIR
jgi:transcriptional regulator with XRE-family HTH domain